MMIIIIVVIISGKLKEGGALGELNQYRVTASVLLLTPLSD